MAEPPPKNAAPLGVHLILARSSHNKKGKENADSVKMLSINHPIFMICLV